MDNIKLIRSVVRQTLSPFGFRVKGNNYHATRPQAILCVNLQKSTSSTLDNPILTVNLGVYSTVLAKISGERDQPMFTSCCHWNERIGWYLNPRSDKWWNLQTDIQHQEAAREIQELLVEHALPEMESLATLDAMVERWRSGQCMGLSEFQRKTYLKEIDASGYYANEG